MRFALINAMRMALLVLLRRDDGGVNALEREAVEGVVRAGEALLGCRIERRMAA